MQGRESPTAPSRKYRVAKRLGRWRVTYDEASIGTFEDAATATRFACDVARLEAEAGIPTVVVVQAALMETHCFTPPASTQAAPRAKLRLVGPAE